jgi:hypothetical protein
MVLVAGCCEVAVWSEVIAPEVPPVVAAPWLIDAEELEQVSATLVTLDTLITLPAVELALVAPLLVCALADDALPASEPLIWTCCPTWLCNWLVSPWIW